MTLTAKDIREFNQVRGVYEKERAANRDVYVALAETEAARRGIELEG